MSRRLGKQFHLQLRNHISPNKQILVLGSHYGISYKNTHTMKCLIVYLRPAFTSVQSNLNIPHSLYGQRRVYRYLNRTAKTYIILRFRAGHKITFTWGGPLFCPWKRFNIFSLQYTDYMSSTLFQITEWRQFWDRLLCENGS